MKVFLSWSGDRSKTVAEALGSWLRQVIQAIDPWSSTVIGKGARWGPEISAQLELTKVGIICLTRDNLTEPWILFEAGALSKTKDAVVATFLLDIEKSDVKQPLSQFQHTSANELEVRQLVHTLNDLVRSSGERALVDSDLDEVFDLFWPKLKEKIDAIPPAAVGKSAGPIRTDSDILREILDVVRNQATPPPTAPRPATSVRVGMPTDVTQTYHVNLPSAVVKDFVRYVGNGSQHIKGFQSSDRENGGADVTVFAKGPAMKAIQNALKELGVNTKVKKFIR